MAHKAVTVGQTTSQRARQRARESRLRAIYHHPGRNTTGHPPFPHGHYTVYNLKEHRRYTVACRGPHTPCTWVCHCEGAKGQKRCKHVQRVMDREERRVKEEALARE